MTVGRSDLPIKGGTAGRFVVSLVAVLVFMAALAATVNFYIGSLLADWNQSVQGTLTVQIATTDVTAGATPDEKAKAVLAALKSHTGVESAAMLPREKVVALLEPWLGDAKSMADLPLPILIDVTLRTDSEAAVKDVSSVITAAAPSAVIDDHRVWLNRVIGLAEGISVVAWTIMALVTGALGLTVIFATRASLTEFSQVIEVMHLFGAKDGYVARQFAWRSLRQGIGGGLIGLALYAPALVLVAWLASRIDPGVLPHVSLPHVHWLMLAALPVLAGVIAMVTAHITVRHSLANMV
jgi:cell division transport system permease protein